MAVEARHLNLFPPQLVGNRQMMNPIEPNSNIFNNAHHHHHHQSNIGLYGLRPAGAIGADALLPSYNSPMNDPPKTARKSSDSGLTYNVNPTPYSRKRSRDHSLNPPLSYPINAAQLAMNKNCSSSPPFSFLGEDISLHLQLQQFDIDRLVSQHMEKVRMEIEEKRKRQARKILEAIEVGMMKRLRAKEEEIEKIGKLNWALEEKVKSLCIENQIWRDLAQTNEATANALRTNLEQVLQAAAAQVKDRGAELENDDADDEDGVAGGAAAELADDAQSCCGENYDVGQWRPVVATGGGRNDDVKEETTSNVMSSGNRMCRSCGKEEACVLLLPCRHLCLCTVCGSSLHTCPICKSTKNASVHINMSS